MQIKTLGSAILTSGQNTFAMLGKIYVGSGTIVDLICHQTKTPTIMAIPIIAMAVLGWNRWLVACILIPVAAIKLRDTICITPNEQQLRAAFEKTQEKLELLQSIVKNKLRELKDEQSSLRETESHLATLLNGNNVDNIVLNQQLITTSVDRLHAEQQSATLAIIDSNIQEISSIHSQNPSALTEILEQLESTAKKTEEKQRSNIHALQRQLKELQDKFEESQTQLTELQEQLAKSQTSQTQLEQLQNKLEELQNKLTVSQTELDKLRQKSSDMQQKLDMAQVREATLKNEVDRLKNEIDRKAVLLQKAFDTRGIFSGLKPDLRAEIACELQGATSRS